VGQASRRQVVPPATRYVDEGRLTSHGQQLRGVPAEAREPPIGLTVADAATRRRDLLLIGLTFAAGVVDAVSYLGLGQIFTANMTGNVVFLALAIGERSPSAALHSGAALIIFSVGAIIAGLVLVRPRPAGTWPRRVTWLLWGELACLGVFAVIWVLLRGEPGLDLVYILIGLSSFGLGFQNAAARHLGVPGLTSTVVTGALTGFMVDLPALGISGTSQRRAGWAVMSLFTGAALGATLMIYARLFAPSLTVAAVAVVALVAWFYFRQSGQTIE
jgi:uncharacterized membrane protein YoaK (UPF0700 family)